MNKESKINSDVSLKKRISADLRTKANDFLNSRKNANNLVDIIAKLNEGLEENNNITAPLLTLEVIFVQLLKRKEIHLKEEQIKDDEAESKYRTWLRERYEEAWQLVLKCFEHEKVNEASQALVTCMKLMAAESKWPLEVGDTHGFPKYRLRRILQTLLSTKKTMTTLIQRLKEYAEYFDIVFYAWKLLSHLANKDLFKNKIYALNLLELMNVFPISSKKETEPKLLCLKLAALDQDCYGYTQLCKHVNKTWNTLMQCNAGLESAVHKQMLIVLLERVMPHLEQPVLLTDFLMDSLDCGGPVSLLALQGIFTLIQKHNITYPNVYEKLYAMFEPEVFHMKFKARLFYLADIFLTSTHLPESLVAAFAKRLARLSLVAPPQDAIIMVQFIGNLILRHPSLKRLISAPFPTELSTDPFLMEERDPTMSKALESSLWELVLLQKHAVPVVANAARFINHPLPAKEWDLSAVLDVEDGDLFNEEISKKSKLCALAFERPESLALVNNEKLTTLWKLF